MDNIHVNLKQYVDNSYDIVIGTGLLGDAVKDIARKLKRARYLVVTDSNVESLYGNRMLQLLQDEGLDADMISFPAGERYKNRDTKEAVEDYMLERKFGRDSAVIALGGGVVGDLAGYVAATYMRGLPYVQVPTTLVACVDSSVGGKTAVDTVHGKNLIGAFHQPEAVYIDVDTLKTLQPKEVREGLAEVIKYGVISDAGLFSFLETGIDKIFSFDSEALTRVIRDGCTIKGDVVERDERESDLRKILNFGHTVGHAVENLSDYAVSHGEAISIGMVVEGMIALEMSSFDKRSLERLIALLSEAGLPTEVPENMNTEDIIETMKLDKKSRGGSIEMALPSAIGKMLRSENGYGIRIDEALIHQVLAKG